MQAYVFRLEDGSLVHIWAESRYEAAKKLREMLSR